MTPDEIKEKIEETGCFRKTTVNINTKKEIADIYTRCTLLQDEFLAKIATIDNIKVVPCDFGIFELIIPINVLEETIDCFVKTFKE